MIGVKKELILRRFLHQQPVRSEPADGDVRLEGALLECDADGPRDVGRALPALRLSGPGGACALSYPVSMTAAPLLAQMTALPQGRSARA